ncbi:MAG: tetratricopeptide repeat protein, partial [Chloroflexota bacterium]
IKAVENKSIGLIRDEIGYDLERNGGSAVERWGKGHIPPETEDIESLARIFIKRGKLPESWIRKFLEYAGYPNINDLCANLFHDSDAVPGDIYSAATNGNPTAQPIPDSVNEQWQTKVNARLEPQGYSQLFGIDEYILQLNQHLLELDDIWLIAIQGMGGLGKTTLADYVVRQPEMSQRFEEIAWVTIKKHGYILEEGRVTGDDAFVDREGIVEMLCTQLGIVHHQALPPHQKQNALITHLKRVPCLIVLDNLEELPDMGRFIPFLHSLTNPSKILITSRHALPQTSGIAPMGMKRLPKDHATAFLRHLLGNHGSSALASATDAQLGQMYDRVGGHPLALRMVASQVRILSLPVVLQNLSAVPDDETDTLYHFLYHRSWELLSPDSQQLLALMPLVDNGSSEQLAAIAELRISELNTALRQLVRMSLIEVRGGLEEKRYFIYRLTETFLRKQTLAWKAQPHRFTEFQFRRGTERNLDYWQAWLEQHSHEVDRLHRDQAGVVKAIWYGLDVPDALPSAYALIEQFSPYMEHRGHWQSWGNVLDTAIETAQGTNGNAQLPSLSISHARLLRHQSRYLEAVSEYVRAIRLSRQAKDRYAKARAWSNLGHLYIELDRWWRAEVLCVHSLQIFEETDSVHGRAHTHNHLGILYTRQCRWDVAWHHLQQALSLWQEMDELYGIAVANLNLGKLANDMRMEAVEPPCSAHGFLERAIDYGTQTADEVAVAIARMNLGITYKLDGELDEAERIFHDSAKIFEEYGDALSLALISDNLGVIYGERGNPKQAMHYLQKALDKWRALHSRYGEIRTLLYLAEWELKIWSKKSGQDWLEKAGDLLSQGNTGEKYPSLQKTFERLSSSL